MEFTMADFVGTLGVFLLLAAFLLNLLGRIRQSGPVYIWLNVIGAGLACAASILIRYYPFVVLEGAWTVVSLFALFKYLRTRSA